MKLNNAIMWISVSLAVIIGLITTKDTNCILGFFIPTFVTLLESEDDEDDEDDEEDNDEIEKENVENTNKLTDNSVE